MTFIVYCITNIINGKQYIGITTQSLNIRWSEHISRSRYKEYNSNIHAAIRKYGKENFIIEHIASAINLKDLKALEIQLVAQYNTFLSGYNLTIGGDFSTHTKETRAKISKSKLGHVVSKECRDRISLKLRKKWKLIYKDGSEIIVLNLKEFCNKNNYSYKTLKAHGKIVKYNIKYIREI